MPENFEHPKPPIEQPKKVVEELSSELLDLRAGLKRDITRALSPQNDEDRRAYYQELKKLQELPSDQRNTVIEDEELKALAEEFFFTSLQQVFDKKEYHDLAWRVQGASEVAKVLKMPKTFEKTENRITLVRNLVANISKSYSAGTRSLVFLSDLIEIPSEILDDPEIQKSLPTYLGIQHPKDLNIAEVAKYLNSYFPV